MSRRECAWPRTTQSRSGQFVTTLFGSYRSKYGVEPVATSPQRSATVYQSVLCIRAIYLPEFAAACKILHLGDFYLYSCAVPPVGYKYPSPYSLCLAYTKESESRFPVGFVMSKQIHPSEISTAHRYPPLDRDLAVRYVQPVFTSRQRVATTHFLPAQKHAINYSPLA